MNYGYRTGAAYVYRRQNDAWVLEAKLAPSDGQTGDSFGYAVAISGDGTTIAVSSVSEDPGHPIPGFVYVFVRSGSSWVQQKKLLPPVENSLNSFGNSIAVSSDGNTLAVGQYMGDPTTNGAGVVYIYVRTGTVWVEQAKLKVSDASDHFGRSVSLSNSGNDIAIGAIGRAYVFTRSGTAWSQQAQLTASNETYGNAFGSSVSISGDGSTVLIGDQTDNTYGHLGGAAYVFTRSGVNWSQHSKLLPIDATGGNHFGNSVSINDNGSVCGIGVYLSDEKGTDSGSVDIFKKNGGVWEPAFKLVASDGAIHDSLGYSVSLSGDGKTCVVGARGDSNGGGGPLAGAAYVFCLM